MVIYFLGNELLYIYDVCVYVIVCKMGVRVFILLYVKRERKRERKNGVNVCRGIYDM